MANINKLGMAKTISTDPRISVNKSFFGLCQTAVYNPTNSKLVAFINDYTAENGEKLKQLLRCPDDRLADLTKKLGPIEEATMGPSRLEGCMSQDHLFAALQLFGYSDFEYSPLTDVVIYEGIQAELISTVI